MARPTIFQVVDKAEPAISETADLIGAALASIESASDNSAVQSNEVSSAANTSGTAQELKRVLDTDPVATGDAGQSLQSSAVAVDHLLASGDRDSGVDPALDADLEEVLEAII